MNYKAEEMRRHQNIVSYSFMIFSIIPAISLFLLYVLFAGSMTFLSVNNHDDGSLLAITGGIGLLLLIIVAISIVPGFLAGYGLLKNKEWGRVLAIVMSIIYLFGFPLGTALGVYALWVLFNDEAQLSMKEV